MDLRAAFGTSIVHIFGGAGLFAGVAVPLTTMCLCRVPGATPMIVFTTSAPVALTLATVPVVPDRIVAARLTGFSPVDRCGNGQGVAPVLLASPTMAAPDTATRPTICVTVDSSGGVVAARLAGSSGSRAVDRAALGAARRARFAAGRPGRVALSPQYTGS